SRSGRRWRRRENGRWSACSSSTRARRIPRCRCASCSMRCCSGKASGQPGRRVSPTARRWACPPSYHSYSPPPRARGGMRGRMRWHDLLWFVLSWALRRRPGAEREELLEAARSSQMDLKHREEVAALSETVGVTWEHELVARGEARGRLEALRENLRLLLEE